MTREQQFWKWFEKHQKPLHAEADLEAVAGAIEEQLEKVDLELNAEVGRTEQGVRELVISTGGIREHFASAQALVAAAPPSLPGWKFIAFRPRRPVGDLVDIDGQTVDATLVRYCLLQGRTTLGLYLFLPGYTEGDAEQSRLGFALLDRALGEFDVETKLGHIKIFAPEADVPGPRYPIKELAAHFDALIAPLHQGTAR